MADQLDLDEKASSASLLRHHERHVDNGHRGAAVGIVQHGQPAAAAIAPRLADQVASQRIDNGRAKKVAVLPGPTNLTFLCYEHSHTSLVLYSGAQRSHVLHWRHTRPERTDSRPK